MAFTSFGRMQVETCKGKRGIPLVRVTRCCIGCGEPLRFKITPDQFDRWSTGYPIRRVFPRATSQQREALVFSLCIACQDDASGIRDEHRRSSTVVL